MNRSEFKTRIGPHAKRDRLIGSISLIAYILLLLGGIAIMVLSDGSYSVTHWWVYVGSFLSGLLVAQWYRHISAGRQDVVCPNCEAGFTGKGIDRALRKGECIRCGQAFLSEDE